MTSVSPAHPRILVADDNDGLRRMLATAFQERGYETLEAGCGQDAVELGRREHPLVSLLDLNMPDMTGVEVVRRWLASGLVMPVIFMTADANVMLRTQARQLGAVDVLDKPFSIGHMFGLVRASLGMTDGGTRRDGASGL